MPRSAFALLLGAALAAQEEGIALRLVDGSVETVAVSSFDEEGVFTRSGAAERKIPWASLRPDSAFLARKTLTPPNDGAARCDLVRFARALKLFPQALDELEVSLALGGMDADEFEKGREEIRAEEQEYLCSRIDALLASGKEPKACIEAIRALSERYADHPGNAKYAPRVAELAKAAAEAEPERPPGAEHDLPGLRKTIGELRARKDKALARAEALQEEAEAAVAKGQLSRIKKTLLKPSGAEKCYRDARDCLRAMARADKNSLVTAKADLRKEYTRIGTRLVDCYLVVARALIRERNYKETAEYVRKVLLLDPIHEEALKMIEDIEKNRIGFRSSATGGAVPERGIDD